MTATEVPRNLSLDDAVRIARELGINVSAPNRKGELLFVAPDGERRRQNARKKDANMKVTSMLRRVAQGKRTHTQEFRR